MFPKLRNDSTQLSLLPRSAEHKNLDAFMDLQTKDLTPSDAWDLVLIKASTKYIKGDFRTMTSYAWICSFRLKPVVPNLLANEKCKIALINTAGATCSNHTPLAALFLRGQK